MADTYTPFLNLVKPTVGGDTDTWGTLINGDMDAIDAGVQAAQTKANSSVQSGNGHALTLTWDGTNLQAKVDTTAGGALWTTNNFTPGNYLPIAGGTLTGAITVPAMTSNGNIQVNGGVYVGSNNASLQQDGNVYGTMWGGWLSNRITERRNSNANRGYVITDSNNWVQFNWEGSRLRCYIDSTNQGLLWTDTNFNPGNYATVNANCNWNSGIVESGQIHIGNAGTYDTGNPWVVQGVRTAQSTTDIWLRYVYLRNN